ncbi:MAG: 3-isopropylmalate dehydratase small subunit [Chthoniobacterales bacterium]|nr:3-isopropylmalate dehydratase small subunit [Chthoniobacterales bacterium]
MPLHKITQICGRGVYVPGDDIDTDRIIPARFMRCVTFDGLGQYAFYDERRSPDGSEKPHPLNDPRFAGATILLTGRNFGCGSSREHAPQALYRHGFRAILAESFAEIFFGNSLTIGLPCLVMCREDLHALAGLIEADPVQEITVDITSCRVSAADLDFPISLPQDARNALVDGRWDAIADLLEGIPLVQEKAKQLPYFFAN